jgi:hypothetical protein
MERAEQGQTDTRMRASKPACLLTTVHRERALSRALVQHLSEELPDIEFTLEEREHLSAAWVCGYDPTASAIVRTLRTRHPEAFLIVTGRAPVESWEDGARAAGADFATSWPVPFEELSRLLHSRRLGQPR